MSANILHAIHDTSEKQLRKNLTNAASSVAQKIRVDTNIAGLQKESTLVKDENEKLRGELSILRSRLSGIESQFSTLSKTLNLVRDSHDKLSKNVLSRNIQPVQEVSNNFGEYDMSQYKPDEMVDKNGKVLGHYKDVLFVNGGIILSGQKEISKKPEQGSRYKKMYHDSVTGRMVVFNSLKKNIYPSLPKPHLPTNPLSLLKKQKE